MRCMNVVKILNFLFLIGYLNGKIDNQDSHFIVSAYYRRYSIEGSLYENEIIQGTR